MENKNVGSNMFGAFYMNMVKGRGEDDCQRVS